MPVISCTHAITHILLVRLHIISSLDRKSVYLTGILSVVLLGWCVQASMWISCSMQAFGDDDGTPGPETLSQNVCYPVLVGDMQAVYTTGNSDAEQSIGIAKWGVACAILIE